MPSVQGTGDVVSGDVLDRRWVIAVYSLLLVPVVGPGIIIFGSSILYYSWRGKTPRRAATLNKHAWMAWSLGLLINLGVMAWHKLMG